MMARPFHHERRYRRTTRVWVLRLSLLLAAVSGQAHGTFDAVDCHANGVVGVVAGAGVAGFRDGRLTRSLLNTPASAACNSTRCYVSDSGNNAIREVDVGKSDVRLYAGSSAGVAGGVDGERLACEERGETSALFDSPGGVALVSQTSAYYPGDVLVADTGNSAIRRISGDVVSTVMSSVAGYKPVELAFDESDGSLYFTDYGKHNVLKLAYGASAPTSFVGHASTPGFTDSVTASSVRFNAPLGLAMDSANGKVYVADSSNHAVREITLSTGAVSTVLGDGSASTSGSVLDSDGISSTPARFSYPSGIAYVNDASISSGVLLVADTGRHRIRKIVLSDSSASNAATVVTVAGSYTGTAGYRDSAVGSEALFYSPRAISHVDGDTYVVADTLNHALRKVRLEDPVDVTFTIQSVAHADKSAESHDLVIEEYGSYSINGPPYNETTHFSGVLTYVEETHELTMCAYPSVDYFVKFQGAMQAMVKDSDNYLYIGYTGSSAEDGLSQTFRLRGPGCTDAAAPNYNPFATGDDGSCVEGITLTMLVGAFGSIEHAVYEFEGPGVYVTHTFEVGSGEDGYEQTDEFEFVAYPGAVYVATFYGAMNASLTTNSGQSGLGSTEVTYWTYNSTLASDQGVKRARVKGPGCTDSSYSSYDQYATASDELNACTVNEIMRVTINASASSVGWYDYGSIVGSSDVTAVLDGVSLDNSSDQVVATINAPPGVYEFESFGDVSVSVEKQTDAAADDFDAVVAWLGSNALTKVDAHGFATTLGSSRVVAKLSPRGTQLIPSDGSVGFAGGIINGDDDGSSITYVEGSVPRLTTITSTFLKTALTPTLQNSLWYNWNLNVLDVTPNVMTATPTTFQLEKAATLSLKYDKTSVPSQEGNDDVILFRSSGAALSDAFALNGASFDTQSGTVTAEIDTLGTYGVAFRAAIRSVYPPRGWIDGGQLVTLDGVDFSSLSTLNTETTYQKCQFGTLWTNATTVASLDSRSTLSGSDSTVIGTKLNAVRCKTPQRTTAAYTAMEFYDSKNGMTSDQTYEYVNASGTGSIATHSFVFLQTAAPQISSVYPREGVVSGGSVVNVVGHFLRAGALSSDWEKYDADSTFFANAGPTRLSCVFGSSTTQGVAVSSVVARCESPISTSTGDSTVRVGDAAYNAAGYATYTYVSDFDSSISVASWTDNGGENKFVTDGGVALSLDDAIGDSTKPREVFEDWRCLIGTVSVAARSDIYGALSCISVSVSRGTTSSVRLVGPLGEGSLNIGSITSATYDSTYVDSQVVLPGDAKRIESIRVIERAASTQFWEPLKWISASHALISSSGAAWVGTGQGFGHASYGIPNCTFTTDSGTITTSVATIVSSALVVCEAPPVEFQDWSTVEIRNERGSSGSPKTSLLPWFDRVTRTHTHYVGDVITSWSPPASVGGVTAHPMGHVSTTVVSDECFFGTLIESESFTSNSGCAIPRALTPGFVPVALGVSSTFAPKFEHQIQILTPLRSRKVFPHFIDMYGGTIVEFEGENLYSDAGEAPVYCGLDETSKVFQTIYVSSALIKCEVLASDGESSSARALRIGRADDFEGSEPNELSSSPQNQTIASLANAFGVHALPAPTVTGVSPLASTARGGAVFGINGTHFAQNTAEVRCVFGNVFVTAFVYNSTYADCVVPSLYPTRTYDVSVSMTGSAGQRMLDAAFTYANGTSLEFTPY